MMGLDESLHEIWNVWTDSVKCLQLLSVKVGGMDVASDWGMFPLSSVVKQRASKPVFQARLTDHATWEPITLTKPTQVVDFKQYGIRGR